MSFQMKIIDLERPWRSLTTSTVGHPSDSWASCHHIESSSWSAWANDTAAHYAAIHCPR